MITDNTLTFTEEVNPNDFVMNDEDTSYFDNAWERTKILQSPRTEIESIVETARMSRDKLIKDYPEQTEAISKYAVYDAPIDSSANFKADGEEGIANRLERQRFKKYFDEGLFYKDQDGTIKGNTPSADALIEDDKGALKAYWDYRLLTDGTEFDMATLEQRNIARMQDELIRLRSEASGANGLLDELGGFAGTMGFIMTEPEVIATMIGSTGNVGRGILGNAGEAFAKEAGLSLVADAMIMPKVMEWRRKLYDPARGIEAYSTLDAVGEALFNAGFAGAIQSGGSLVVDGATKFKYRGVTASGADKFSVIDKKRKRVQKGYIPKTEEVKRKERLKELNEALSASTESGGRVGDELVSEVDDIIQSSPSGSVAKHVDTLGKAQEHIENSTGFPNGELTVKADEAIGGDFVAVKQPDGATVMAKVTDSDETHLGVELDSGEMVVLNRATREGDVDGYSLGDKADPLPQGDHVERVNETNIQDIIKRDNAEHELISLHSEDKDIKWYNKGEEETLQKMVDEGCLTIDQLKGGE